MSSLPFFIVLEGGDGVGKSTQVRLLRDYLERQGMEVRCTSEPGGTDLGRSVRELVVTNNDIDPLTEMFLVTAARVEHIKTIREWLSKGFSVICDRFIESTYVYQNVIGGLRNTHPHLMNLVTASIGLDTLASLARRPVTFILDCDPQVVVDRIALSSEHKSKFDVRGLEFHTKVREAYLYIAHGYRQGPLSVVIDANGSSDQVFDAIVFHLNRLFPYTPDHQDYQGCVGDDQVV
jgi:dTMP kinase